MEHTKGSTRRRSSPRRHRYRGGEQRARRFAAQVARSWKKDSISSRIQLERRLARVRRPFLALNAHSNRQHERKSIRQGGLDSFAKHFWVDFDGRGERGENICLDYGRLIDVRRCRMRKTCPWGELSGVHWERWRMPITAKSQEIRTCKQNLSGLAPKYHDLRTHSSVV